MKGLSAGQDVYVISPTGVPVDARVDEVAADKALLTLFTRDRDPMTRLANEEIEVQFVNRRGVCRVTGVAHHSSRGATALQFKSTGDVRVIQRREFVRVDAVIPVEYAPQGGGGWKVRTHTVNVSGGGFLLASPEGLKLGQTLPFEIDLGEGEGYEGGLIPLVGKAVRQTDGGALGIEIVDIAEDERKRIIRFVFAREVYARKTLRDAV